MLFTMHWQANSSRGCLCSFSVSSSGGTIVAKLNRAFSGARQLGKTSAKKYHHIPMLGVESGPCKSGTCHGKLPSLVYSRIFRVGTG